MEVNADIFKGKWNEMKGKVKQQWAKLTDDDIQAIEGRREELVGKLQQRYGYSKEQAKKELENFNKKFH